MTRFARVFGLTALAVAACGLTEAAPALSLERVRMASGQTVDALPGQVIVRYRDGAAAGQAHMAALGAHVRASVDAAGLALVSVPAGRPVESFLAQLRSDPNVEFAEPNGVVHALSWPSDKVTEPNDASFSSEYWLRYDAANFPATINVKDAWAITTGTPSVIVAVVDTGAAQSHTDLVGQLVTGERMEIDWNGDGDCTGSSQFGPDQCGGTSTPPNHDPEDDNNLDEFGNVDVTPTYHGTHVSGLIVGHANNGSDIAGVAPNCRVMPVKALNAEGNGTFFSIASGILWAADHGASVINLSLGGSEDTSGSVQLAISHALGLNCVIVAAAGNNSSSVNFPASMAGVIAVGSINQTNQHSSFSCTGSALDLVAPGESVLSLTKPAGTSSENGTSFASPIVAGVAALIRSVRPTMSWEDVTKYINFTASDLGPGGYDTTFGFGRVNAGAAVAAAESGAAFISNPAEPNDTFPYPNPFHPGNGNVVTISLPQSLGTQGISIDILNVAGEKIRTLNDTNIWDGTTDDGSVAASGFYFYRAKTSQGDAKGKLTLIK